MKSERKSGILLHITSLPGPYGIGDIGPEAYKFVDFLYETNQKIWQILPLTPTEKCSPYSGISAFAGHPLLISLEKLVEMNLLEKEDLIIPSAYQFNDHYVKFQQVTLFKYSILRKAFDNFKQQQNCSSDLFKQFFQSEEDWLDDYSLFMAIKDQQDNKSWSQWPYQLKYHQKEALEQIRQTQNDLIEYYIFLQYIFHQQWSQLKTYANQFSIEIIGDMPVYVDYDSADVWANTHLFQIDQQTLLPTTVSGFPPDDCSEEGQNWNMPIYHWNDKFKQDEVFNWWIKRLKKTLQIVDVVRIDHFRGLESYWSIPVDENFVPLKPKNGEWVKAPGVEFFNAVFNALGKDLPLIVEDLGCLSKEVFDLRDQFNLTGIRILQFGFCFQPDNIYRPHNYIENCIAYTSTHDNPTTIGWWTQTSSEDERETFINYIKLPNIFEEDDRKGNTNSILMSILNKSIHWYLIQMVLSTVAKAAIIQFQDVLGLDNKSRMNDPASSSNPNDDGPQNWTWRFTWSMLKENSKYRLNALTKFYNRGGLNKEF